MTKYPYIQRLQERNRNDSLKRQIVLGLVLGWLSVLVGAYKAFFVPGADETTWNILLWTGVMFLSISLILPSLLSIPEKWWSYGASGLGKLIFSTVLALTYLFMFWPVGFLLRWRRGSQGFYEWEESAPQLITVWQPYDGPSDVAAGEEVRREPLIFQPFRVLMFFARRGQYLFLPVLLFLLLLGLAMFFVQSSSLAPFIYTLF